MPASSFVDREDVSELWDFLAMLESVSKDPKGKSLDLCYCLGARGTVSHNPWQISDFADPPTVLLRLDLYTEIAHRANSNPGAAVGIRRANGPALQRRGPRRGMVTHLRCSNAAGHVRCKRKLCRAPGRVHTVCIYYVK